MDPPIHAFSHVEKQPYLILGSGHHAPTLQGVAEDLAGCPFYEDGQPEVIFLRTVGLLYACAYPSDRIDLITEQMTQGHFHGAASSVQVSTRLIHRM